MTIRVSEAGFDPGAETNAFIAAADGVGAAVTFTGLVRSTSGDPVETLTLECYPELAVAQIEKAVRQAKLRFGVHRAAVIHRYGTLQPGEPIVQVMTVAAHRAAAFEAAEFLMDYLKTDAPFWKKETVEGNGRWVESREADEAARRRWTGDGD